MLIKNKITLLMPLLWIIHSDAIAGCSSPYQTGPTSDGEVTDVYGTPSYAEGSFLCINNLSRYVKQHIKDYPDFCQAKMGYKYRCDSYNGGYYWSQTDSECSSEEKRESSIKTQASRLSNQSPPSEDSDSNGTVYHSSESSGSNVRVIRSPD
ncbi:MAG: hypothetical protein PHH11_15585 [Methylomonas sp.]|nr:hypothetical protein [Methylomonas sp.]